MTAELTSHVGPLERYLQPYTLGIANGRSWPPVVDWRGGWWGDEDREGSRLLNPVLLWMLPGALSPCRDTALRFCSVSLEDVRAEAVKVLPGLRRRGSDQ